ncbi:hypothetical protein PAMP_011340 [Pampus punctatissimus]
MTAGAAPLALADSLVICTSGIRGRRHLQQRRSGRTERHRGTTTHKEEAQQQRRSTEVISELRSQGSRSRGSTGPPTLPPPYCSAIVPGLTGPADWEAPFIAVVSLRSMVAIPVKALSMLALQRHPRINQDRSRLTVANYS